MIFFVWVFFASSFLHTLKQEVSTGLVSRSLSLFFKYVSDKRIVTEEQLRWKKWHDFSFCLGLISTHLHLIESNYRSRLYFPKILYVPRQIPARNPCPCMDVLIGDLSRLKFTMKTMTAISTSINLFRYEMPNIWSSHLHFWKVEAFVCKSANLPRPR